MQEIPVNWRPFAVLRHTTAAGSSHYDWLLDEGNGEGQPDTRRVRAFRCGVQPGELASGERLSVEPLPLHRFLYLSITAPTTLSGDRGVVETVCRGTWRSKPAFGTQHEEWLEIVLERTSQAITFLVSGDQLTRIG